MGLREQEASVGRWEFMRATRTFWLVGFDIPQEDLFWEMTRFRSQSQALAAEIPWNAKRPDDN